MKQVLAALAFTLAPFTAMAHPHVFIDAGVSFIFDKTGKLYAVRIKWSYDDMYTMLQLDDMGLDKDGDGTLTAAEQDRLKGIDIQWVEGFEGDTYLTHAGAPIVLGPPTNANAEVIEGKMLTSHVRRLETPLDLGASPVSLKAYDPTYYTAYTLALGAGIQNRHDCFMEQIPADLDKAYTLVETLLYGENAPASEDAQYPAVGEHFADTITLSCEHSS